MIATETPPEVHVLEDRLRRGLDVLFDREQRGETDADFDRWLERWLGFLARYEQLAA